MRRIGTILESGLLFLLVFTPLAYGMIHTWSITVFRVVALLLLILWLVQKGFEQASSAWYKDHITIFALLYFAINLISLIVSINLDDSQEEVANLLAYMAVFFVAAHIFTSPARIIRLTCVLAGIAVLLSIYSILQHYGIDFIEWIPPASQLQRSFATLAQPNRLAGYLIVILPLLMVLVVATRSRIVQTGLLLSMVLGYAGLLFSYSRGGWLGLAGALGCLSIGVLYQRKIWPTPKQWVIGAVVIIVLVVMTIGQRGSRLFTVSSFAIENVRVDYADSRSVVSWDTNEPASGGVYYRLKGETLYRLKQETSALQTSHRINLEDISTTDSLDVVIHARNSEYGNIYSPTGVSIFGVGSRFRITPVPQLVKSSGSEVNVWLRLSMWRATWGIITSNPWLGVGLGAYKSAIFQEKSEELQQLAAFSMQTSAYSHNDYLQIASEIGIPGLLIFIALLCVVFIRLRLIILKHPNITIRYIFTGLATGLTAILIHSLVDFNLHLIPHATLFWLMMGSVAGITRSSEDVKIESAPSTRWGWRLSAVGCLCLLPIQIASYISETHQDRAQNAYINGQLDQSISAFEQALTFRPFSAQLNIDLSSVYENKYRQNRSIESLHAALESFEEGIKQNPYFVPSYVNFARMLLTYRNQLTSRAFDRAEDLLHQGVAINPYYWSLHSNLGVVHYLKRNFNAAETSYHHALDLNPDAHDVYNNLGALYGAMERLDDSVEAYQKALNLYPDWVSAHLSLGGVYNRQKKPGLAIQQYQKALTFDKENMVAWQNIGQVAQQDQRWDMAVEAYRTVVQYQPDNLGVWNNLGVVLYAKKQYEEAIECFEHIIAQDSRHMIAHQNLGNCYAIQGKLTMAEHYYEIALQIDPTNSVTKQRLQVIRETKDE